ncbi:MAG: hypothetical protein HY234_03240 [Acidobacteria bacterium]|nr:hypothetical protein [Acidobacteriota bacterium]
MHYNSAFSSSYLTRGNLTQESRWLNTDATWKSTVHTYDDLGNLRSSTDPGGHITTYSYTDDWANTACIPTDVNTQAFVTQVTNHLGHRTQKRYFPCPGLVQRARDENDILAGRDGTTYSFDFMNRLVAQNLADGGQTAYGFNDAVPFRKTTTQKITSATNLVTEVKLDGLGRPSITKLVSDPQGVVYTRTDYDALSRKATEWNPSRCNFDVDPPPTSCSGESTFGTTQYQYDALSRATKVIPPDGSSSSNNITTAYSGNTVTVTDQAGKQRRSYTDALGRLIQVDEPNPTLSTPAVTTYTYDALDNLTNVLQSGSRQRTFTYNSLSQLLSASNPESGTISYSYDNDGNLLAKASPAPNQTNPAVTVTTTFSYDELHRLKQKNYSDTTPLVKYSYDGVAYLGCASALSTSNSIGRRTAMCDGAGQESWSYDVVGRLLIDRRTTNSVTKDFTYAYNLDSSLASLTYPNNRVVTYAYNAAGRALSAVDAANSINYALNASYAPQGALSSLQNGANIVSTFYYNNRLQPCRISVKSSGTAPTQCSDATNIGNMLDFTYGFNAGTSNNGNVASIANNRNTNRSQSFTYDELNRVKTAQTQATTQPHCWGETFGYDIWGNLLTIGGIQPQYNGCTQESLSVGATAKNQIGGYTYDAAGNLINNPGVATYSYDAENRMTTTAGVTYTYDGDGKRVKKSNGKLYWYGSGSDPLEETDLSGTPTADYIFFNAKRTARVDLPSATVHYYFANHLGSANVVTSSTGVIQDESDFYPFGGERTVTDTDPNQYKFTGKERDAESGLDFFDARYYGSNFGRFMSPDLLGGHLEDPQTLNKYSYVRNLPTTLTDPTGLDFNLSCTQTKDNGSTCQGGVQGTTTTDANGKSTFTATVISSDANGGLVDQKGNQYNATVSGAGVSFSQAGSNQSSTGVFINGSNATTVQGSGDLAGFSFNFTYSNMRSGVTAGGTFTYSGTYGQAEGALMNAGFQNYFGDTFNPIPGHFSTYNYNAVDFRSPGRPGAGAGSGHFTVREPVLRIEHGITIRLSQTVPTTGTLHLGEHNPYTGGMWSHIKEVLKYIF